VLLQVENVSSPSAFAFAENGKHFVIGYVDGRVSVVSTETGNELFHFELGQGQHPIACLSWKSIDDPYPTYSNLYEAPQPDSHLRNLTSILDSKLDPSISESLNFSQTKKSLVFVGSQNNDLSVIYGGFTVICQINLSLIFKTLGAPPASKITRISPS
jgi:hypothetical protein